MVNIQFIVLSGAMSAEEVGGAGLVGAFQQRMSPAGRPAPIIPE